MVLGKYMVLFFNEKIEILYYGENVFYGWYELI